MNELTAIQVRVLGCLMEKKETTPDQYPLTLNALRNACNQKSSRNPVTAYTEGEIGHTVRELETMKLVVENWGARTARYEHRVPQVLELHSKGVALLATLMLRGPQTLGELKTHSQRLYAFDDLDDVQFALDKLAEREDPLVTALPRHAHLLAGEPDVPEPARPAPAPRPAAGGRRNVSSGSPYEPVVGFSRAVRIGSTVAVSGTGPIGPDGETVRPGDVAAQMQRCIEIALAALAELGAAPEDVIRTRTFLKRREDWEAASRVHGEVFGEIRPASTMLQVASMVDPDWLVEFEADAVIGG
ncbi:MAG: DUF480 domain-containing protein [Xanthomonadales bacterium]